MSLSVDFSLPSPSHRKPHHYHRFLNPSFSLRQFLPSPSISPSLLLPLMYVDFSFPPSMAATPSTPSIVASPSIAARTKRTSSQYILFPSAFKFNPTQFHCYRYDTSRGTSRGWGRTSHGRGRGNALIHHDIGSSSPQTLQTPGSHGSTMLPIAPTSQPTIEQTSLEHTTSGCRSTSGGRGASASIEALENPEDREVIHIVGLRNWSRKTQKEWRCKNIPVGVYKDCGGCLSSANSCCVLLYSSNSHIEKPSFNNSSQKQEKKSLELDN